MEKLHKLFYCLTLLLLAQYSIGQTGTVRGTLIDDENGETIPFANIVIPEIEGGISTDLDGMFSVNLDAGVYTFNISYLGYADLIVSDIIAKENETTILDLRLKGSSEILNEVVVTAKAFRNTETALMTIQKKAPGMLDGVTTQSIKRSGDSNVGSAIKRVTGVSVEGGKHVVIRGLGDRYSKTILNGLDVPGLDPDKNSVQLDIFPTNLIDNIIVYKSFTPDLPGDFTGGMVNIETKDFPEEETFNISVGGSYNSNMNLNQNYITYEGSKTDALGFDDGTRALPIYKYTNIPDRTDGSTYLTQLTQRFNPVMSTLREKSGINTNYSLSYGNQTNATKFSLGYFLSANYSNSYKYYNDAQFGVYFRDFNDSSENELFQDRSDRGQLGSNNILWSGLAGLAIKTKKHKFSLSALHSQNGESKAAYIRSVRQEFGQAIVDKHVLEYAQRSVSNILLKGRHNLMGSDLEINWKLSPTLSNMTEPDIRLTAYENPEPGLYELNASTAGIPSRTFRYLDEINYAGRIDISYKLDVNDKVSNKIKFGVSTVIKERDFSIFDFNFPLHKRGTYSLTGNPDEIFAEENLWTTENDRGTYLKGAFEPSKSYEAKQQVISAYVMNEMELGASWKAIYGLRVEKSDNWYTGRKQIINDPQKDQFDNRKVLNELDFLPSLGIVKTLKDVDNRTMNLRGSFSRTLARPSFKEKSIAQIADRISGRLFLGNIELEQVNITNADLRWEYFLPNGEMFSISSFYKHFVNPIELTAFDATAPTSFTPRNVGNADLIGIELEFRKRLSFLHRSLSSFLIKANTTIVKSEVNMTENEYAGRLLAQRDGESISRKREMVGQSPYLINGGLSYLQKENGLEANVSYNVQGERLSIVGIANVPDVYEKAFHSLNFKLSQHFGSDQKLNLSVSVKNILNSKRSKVYQSYQAADQLFESFEEGVSYGISISYRFI